MHTFSPSTLLAVFAVLPLQQRQLRTDPDDYPVATTPTGLELWRIAGLYYDVIATQHNSGRHLWFGQHENDLFGSLFNDGSNQNSPDSDWPPGASLKSFVSTTYKATSWLTLIGGLRQSHFQASFTENATYPRLGIAIQIPKLNWVFRGFTDTSISRRRC